MSIKVTVQQILEAYDMELIKESDIVEVDDNLLLLKGKPIPKYKIGQRVEAHGWGRTDYGVIRRIKWIFHSRNFEYNWGYVIDWEGKGIGLSLLYVPEGYIVK